MSSGEANVKVIDHQPYAWFLLEDDGCLYLDAHCSHSFFDYSVIVAMNKAETEAFKVGGRGYIDKLAYEIHYSAPAARDSQSPYTSRNLAIGGTEEEKLVHTAVMAWREANAT